jgi:hypothetical protein
MQIIRLGKMKNDKVGSVGWQNWYRFVTSNFDWAHAHVPINSNWFSLYGIKINDLKYNERVKVLESKKIFYLFFYQEIPELRNNYTELTRILVKQIISGDYKIYDYDNYPEIVKLVNRNLAKQDEAHEKLKVLITEIQQIF